MASTPDAGQDGVRGLRAIPPRRRRPSAACLILFAAAYVFGGGLGQGLAIIPGVSITFWPPAGIFVAALTSTSKRAWPWFVVVGALSELTCNAIWFHNPIPFACVYFAANAFEALAAAWLIDRFAPRAVRLGTIEEVAAFVVLGACAAPVVGATLIGATDSALGKHAFATAWPLVWLGDGTGLLVTTPLILVTIQTWRERSKNPAMRTVEAVLLGVALVVPTVLAIGGALPTVYVTMPPLLWAAARFQLRGATASLGLLALTTAACTYANRDLLGAQPDVVGHRVVLLQAFLGISAVSSLFVGALSAQRRQALTTLEAVNAELESRVAERTADLRESEARFRIMADSTPVMIWATDPRGRIELANRAYREFFGVTDEQLSSTGSWRAVVHPDDQAAYLRAFAEAIRERAPFQSEGRVRAADGSWRQIASYGVPRFTDDGEFLGHVGSSPDITDRKRAEEALRENARRQEFFLGLGDTLRTLFDPSEIKREAIVRLGARLQVDRVLYADLEDDDDTIVVDSDYRAPGVASAVGRHSFAAFGPQVALGLRDGRTLCVPDVERLDGIDDAIRATYRALGVGACLSVPLMTAGRIRAFLSVQHGRPREWTAHEIGLVEEVAERTWAAVERARVEQALRASEERLRYSLKAASAGSWDWEIASGRVIWSPENYVLYDLDPEPGRPRYEDWEDRIHPEDQGPTNAHVLDVLEGRAPEFRTEFRIVRRDGSIRWLAGLGQVERDGNGVPIRMRGINIDVTERKVAELALMEVDRRKDEFLATLAHELRSPLAPVRNAVHVLRLKSMDGDETRWAREVIERQVRSMARLIEDLMDVSRINRGQLELKRERVELEKIVQGAVETSLPLIEEMNHRLRVELPSTSVSLYADLTRLAQVFANLLNNAAKYTERGGEVALIAEFDGGDVVVSVTDSGIGIPADRLPTIFEMFSQVESALDRSQGGLGIGLSLVRRIVEMHGGRITARSDGPGRGSAFVVRLPLFSEGDDRDSPPATRRSLFAR